MKLHNPTADVFVPDAAPVEAAIRRVTHLGIGAHQDDLEFMAFHGIAQCFDRQDRWFGGITCCNGAGSSRLGPYAGRTDAELVAIRRDEQRRAAAVGRYAVMFQLDYPSHEVKRPDAAGLGEDLKALLELAQPEVLYTHNPADKHDTHVGVVVAALRALRELPRRQRPAQVIGCEVWRSLDWLPDDRKILMDVSGKDDLAAKLNGVFDSQIAGGKRYDRAIRGRRAANATFFESHATDEATQVIFGMDLTPLVQDESMDIETYVCGFVDRLREDIRQKLAARLGNR